MDLITLQYKWKSIKEKINQSKKTRILVDCSHGNSRKKAENQHKVLNSVINQIANGNSDIMGVMIESFSKSWKSKH